jgi:hypothetical protein
VRKNLKYVRNVFSIYEALDMGIRRQIKRGHRISSRIRKSRLRNRRMRRILAPHHYGS